MLKQLVHCVLEYIYSIFTFLMSVYDFSASYFNPIVDFLVKNFSYVRGQNIRGAPYDFRKAPSEFSQFVVVAVHKLRSDGWSMNKPFFMLREIIKFNFLSLTDA